MKVPYLDLPGQHAPIKEEILEAVGGILDAGQFILGEPVSSFEEEFAELCGTRFAVGVSDGTDAIILAMRALGIEPGDEVITVSNSYIGTGNAIVLAGAEPVFVEVREDMMMDPEAFEKAITERTKAVIPVHLTGIPAPMDRIMEVAEQNNVTVIEDAAQAVRAEHGPKRVGSIGKAGCFSLHPLKNLNACGDGGMVTTDDEALYDHLTKARNHGLKNRDECAFISSNARLDALQAAILNVKLKYLPQWEESRRNIAERFDEELKDHVQIPRGDSEQKGVYHTYVIQSEHRDRLRSYLAEQGVETKIHYPVPIHLQEPFREKGWKEGDLPRTEEQSKRILSLPVHPELRDDQIEYICRSVQSFFTENPPSP